MARNLAVAKTAVTYAVAASIAASVAASVAASTAASVAASTTASAAASSVSSSATSVRAGAAVTALMGAQRFSIYGDVADTSAPENKACKGDETSILLLRFSFSSGTPPAGSDVLCDASSVDGITDQQAEGRRLQTQNKRSKASGTQENTAVRVYLASVLLNSTMTYLIAIMVAMLCHSVITSAYRYRFINAKFYKAKAGGDKNCHSTHEEHPLFRPLPCALVYPRFELALHALFATGLVQASSDILGTSAAGFELATSILVAATAGVGFVLLGLLLQVARVIKFYRAHGKAIWKPSEETMSNYADMDDPLFRAIWKCLRLKPSPRMKGTWEQPEEVMQEPGRTERALKRAEWFGVKWLIYRCYGSLTSSKMRRGRAYCAEVAHSQASTSGTSQPAPGTGDKDLLSFDDQVAARGAAEYEEVRACVCTPKD